MATFASNIHRIQQIVNKAVEFGRHVAVSGRSMVNAVETAQELGYLSVPDGVLIDVDDISRFPADRVVLITTGSQGEPLSALSRMASGDHRKVSVTADDVIIISATPIPGNEKHVTRVINDLLRLGAEVIYSNMYEVHVSGHACQKNKSSCFRSRSLPISCRCTASLNTCTRTPRRRASWEWNRRTSMWAKSDR